MLATPHRVLSDAAGGSLLIVEGVAGGLPAGLRRRDSRPPTGTRCGRRSDKHVRNAAVPPVTADRGLRRPSGNPPATPRCILLVARQVRYSCICHRRDRARSALLDASACAAVGRHGWYGCMAVVGDRVRAAPGTRRPTRVGARSVKLAGDCEQARSESHVRHDKETIARTARKEDRRTTRVAAPKREASGALLGYEIFGGGAEAGAEGWREFSKEVRCFIIGKVEKARPTAVLMSWRTPISSLDCASITGATSNCLSAIAGLGIDDTEEIEMGAVGLELLARHRRREC